MSGREPCTTWPAFRDWLILRGFLVVEPAHYPGLASIQSVEPGRPPEWFFLEAPGQWISKSVVQIALRGLRIPEEEFFEP